MNENAITMKKEIRMIANYRALTQCKLILSLFLGITTLYLGYISYAVSPLYILILLNFLPPILTSALKGNQNNIKIKRLADALLDTPFQLSSLKRKYKYSKTKYFANMVSYILAIFLILCWQYNYLTSESSHTMLFYFPLAALCLGLITRLLLIIIYRIKLPYDLSHNRV
ncbi:MAG: hypothetical protein WBI07_09750 [Mobilitalea sp.]